MSCRRPSNTSNSVTTPRSPMSGVAPSTSTMGSRRRAAAMASPSLVWAFSRTRNASSSAWKMLRSTISGAPSSSLLKSFMLFTPFVCLRSTSLPKAHGNRCDDRSGYLLFPFVQLRAQPFFLLTEFRRELGAEVLRSEDLPNFDLGLSLHRVGAALDPLNRLFLGLHLPQPKAGDQL